MPISVYNGENFNYYVLSLNAKEVEISQNKYLSFEVLIVFCLANYLHKKHTVFLIQLF